LRTRDGSKFFAGEIAHLAWGPFPAENLFSQLFLALNACRHGLAASTFAFA
jgi:hypothetical protein